MAALTPEKLITQTMILFAALLAPVLVASVTMNKRDYNTLMDLFTNWGVHRRN
jgi:hypothetical protein